tara:strand:+ start:2221 stop:2448 length:228 start_codon:yes stop_codon:yes gene_type:complete
MIEMIIPVFIAGATGFSVLISRLHGRVTALDDRVDKFELRVASAYVSKTDLNEIMERFETHMTRIENKLDRIILK